MPSIRFAILVALGSIVLGFGCASGPSSEEVAKAIGARVQKLGSPGTVEGERLLERQAVARFYGARDSRPAWDSKDREEILEAIRSVKQDGLDPADYHLAALEKLVDSKERTPESQADLDVLLSDAVAGISDDVRYGRVRPSAVNTGWNADPRDDAPSLDSTLADIAAASSVRQAIEAQRPDHFIYHGLVRELARLEGIVASGGWPAVRAGKKLAPGARDPRVPAIRRRLAVSGELESGAPRDSLVYDRALQKAVELFQARHRLDPKGVVDAKTIAEMNVPAATRANQVRVNMERARWVLAGIKNDFMLVNLPAFKAYRIEDGKNVWEARTQIGEEAMQTPTFRATIRTVVFNPDWTVPPTILSEEILKDMRSGKNAIAEKGLVIYDRENHVVDPSSIDWGSATPETFPYTIRQPAGEDNALGRVKFLFPNKYSIYLHDTPSRHLFTAATRTFSHGCIRLENPLELAELLLRPQGWDPGMIQDALASKETRNVELERPVPILIVYWTVSVGASGEVRYGEDVYDLDPPLLAALDGRARRG
jgi:L,D-transpeptidase YcbB